MFEQPRVRSFAVLAAVAVFAVGLMVALSNYPDLPSRVAPSVWLLVVACVPLTIFANASQFWLTARFVDAPVTLSRAMLITILSTAANMLPLPGGSLVRIAALKGMTNTYRQATAATILIAGCWLGVTMTLAGLALLLIGFVYAGMLVLPVGVGALSLSSYMILRGFLSAPAELVGLAVIQVIAVCVGALRIWLCFLALGESISYPHAMVFTLSTVTAAVIGVAPAGLGVTELLAAGIATGLGVAGAFGFLAAALNRLSGLLVIGPVALILHWLDVHRSARPAVSPVETSKE
ncbi:hypothetical protein NYO91_04950 [Arhodomonas aquaeolei]|uniref:hypothetical protein n=1 Tax=Arhodomonas aquaeolei TaxID=2369 RepID=UPI0021697F4F|nr:hypothetical protein [Arhodomonas aquaeolei]MCS4503423.1 hypothetical protein [Arhodomonas aquaeolei]